jgi:hypothetical protein
MVQQINIKIDSSDLRKIDDKAKRYGIDFDTLAKTLSALDRDIPMGFMKGEKGFYTLTYYG